MIEFMLFMTDEPWKRIRHHVPKDSGGRTPDSCCHLSQGAFSDHQHSFAEVHAAMVLAALRICALSRSVLVLTAYSAHG